MTWPEAIKRARVQQPCPDCGTDNRVELDVLTLNEEGIETVATLVGCTECRSGLCRESE